MDLRSYRTFNSSSASLAADFPALKALFHADDIATGATSWVARHGGLTINMSGAIKKDANGIYTAATNTISSVTGTMPTLSKYAVCVGIGKLNTSSQTAGPMAIFGKTDGSAGGIQANGIAYTAANVGAVNTIATLTGSVTAGSKVAMVGYFDLVDTTSPAIFRVIGGATSGDQAIPNGAATTDLTTPANNPIGLTTLGQDMACSPLTTADVGGRVKIIALFDFSASMVIGDVQQAAVEMARTQELFAGWRNRAAA